MKPVPVLLLCRSLTAGGSERQLAEVARLLPREEFEPHVACFHAEGAWRPLLDAAGVPVLRLPVTSFRSWSAVRGARDLRNYLRRRRIQLVHSFDVPLALFGTPLARAAGVPVVLSSQRGHRSLSPSWQARLLRLTDRLVDGIVVNCEAMRQNLIQDERVPPSRIRVCPNALDTALYWSPPPGERGAAPEPELAASALNIGVVSVLRPEKDLATLVEAFARLWRESGRQGLRLVVIGDGPLRADLEKQAARLELGAACVLAGEQRDVGRWLRWLDVFVLPSRSEALSNALMEAMACGCCPVGSNAGGIPELIREGETGLLFPAGDVENLALRLRKLHADAGWRTKLGAAAATFIRTEYSLEKSIRRMTEVYREFLKLG